MLYLLGYMVWTSLGANLNYDKTKQSNTDKQLRLPSVILANGSYNNTVSNTAVSAEVNTTDYSIIQ